MVVSSICATGATALEVEQMNTSSAASSSATLSSRFSHSSPMASASSKMPGAGDAEQHPLIAGSDQSPVDRGEEVGRGRFGHRARLVKQQDLVESPRAAPLHLAKAGPL